MASNLGSLDRRSFLKGAGVLGAGTAAMALGGCAANSAAQTGAAGTEPDLAATGEGVGSGISGYVGDGDWLGEPPVIADDEVTETVSVDVVICGSGHAGAQAAYAASEEGVSVAILEKNPSQEAHKFLGGEFGNFNSKFLESRGFGGYDLGEVVNEFCLRGGNRVNANLIRMYVENAGPVLDRMLDLIPDDSPIKTEEQLTVHVAYDHLKGEDYPIYQGGYKTWAGDTQFWGPYNDQPVDGVASFSTITEAHSYSIAQAEKDGAVWYWGHEAVVLTQSDNGDVTGVIAKNPDGGYTKFEAAKGVILAAGDFSGNATMVWDLITEVPEWNMRAGVTKEQFVENAFAFSPSDGAGHKMGCWAGGFIEPNPRPTMSMGGGGGPWGTAPFLWLNANGDRYMNEASALGAGPITLRQPQGLVCTVTDSKWLESVRMSSVDHGAPNYTRPQYYDDLETDMAAVVPAGAEGAGVRSCCITERNLATVYGSETLEEALKFAGYEGEALQNALTSIEHYNELCRAGKDTDFGKDSRLMLAVDTPPFYTAPSQNSWATSAGLVTLAGLMTDDNMNVIDANYQPIKGLYATGNCLGGRWGNAYSTPTGGASIGMAMTHGWLAGKIVAAL